ncbi:MAG: NAD-dependent epimerase/dehydratase family protein, partial [Candidatus Poribacteria bacterium]|nr:NAD-dependent epimerase/dehydratase family protein [Candidatus Poribacteria bacterium]
MNVLILGGTGNLGPFVVNALEPYHTLRVTDVNPPEDTAHEFRYVDMASMTQVVEAAEGMDAIVNCSVLREHRKIAFDVNTLGSYHMMSAAVTHGIKRVINT